MNSEFYILMLFSVFSSISSDDRPPGCGEYNAFISKSRSVYHSLDFLDNRMYRFKFTLRLPHWIGDKLRHNQMVIRTFPTEINDFKENTDYTKNISLEMETSCGSSKSAFDKTDVVTLTLMEKENNHSVFVKTIRVDPLSVDFYSPKPTMEQFKMLAENEIKERTEFCNHLCVNQKLFGKRYTPPSFYLMICPKEVCKCQGRIKDYSQSFAEMEKFVKIMKYLELFQYKSPSCEIDISRRYKSIGAVELDNKTASSFPKLDNNHYFVASFTDTKARKSAALILKDFRII